MAVRHVSLNGRLVKEEEALLPVLDRGLLFGDGVFETLRSYDGFVFRLESHLERLRRSLSALEIEWAFETAAVRREMNRLLEANSLRNARIRLTVTGGLFDGSIRLRRTEPPNVILTATALEPPGPERYAEGIVLATASWRQSWNSPLARVKTNHRLEYLMAREEALRSGADDALILDDRGQVAECSSSNIFLLLGGRLMTPPLESPILPGVTRDVAIEAAQSIGITVEERQIAASEVTQASEIFVTATSWEIMAVRSLDGSEVGDGRRGPATMRIHEAFGQIVQREIAVFND